MSLYTKDFKGLPNDFGGGFAMGSILGSFFYFFKGALNAPRQQRLANGLLHVRRRAPIMGGMFALWAGTYSGIDYTIFKITGKSSIMNSVVSGFMTGGILNWRCNDGVYYLITFLAGYRIAFRSACSTGLLLSIFACVQTGFQKQQLRLQFQQRQELVNQQNAMLKKQYLQAYGAQYPQLTSE